MSNRITKAQLQSAVALLNHVTNSPTDAYIKSNDKYTAQIGNYHLSCAYGGYSLHRMVNDSGGVSDVLSTGHTTARELYNLIHAFRRGFELSQQA